ncbi:egl nine homolog 1-like isoform X2 [Dreissena polymorpha]|uniref:egl nine homolog 1-like isoform X2 n=1 Tax=Dreissena polymorpha TaxID=45954 RepID=UPI0022648932|nr:egl nine homolog 1-like isoform X2 [Dreissena polymorpha]
MADLESEVSCTVCGSKIGIKRCGVCKITYYCSREHQIKGWGQHKAICMVQMNGQSSAAPGNSLRMASQNESIETAHNTVNSSTGSDACKSSLQHTQTNTQTAKDDDAIPFDERPVLKKEFLKLKPRATESYIAQIAVQNLFAQGFCVIDGIFSQSQISNALKDINNCLKENKFDCGRLEGGRTSGEVEKQVVNSNIRCDKIMWLEGSESHLPGISSVVLHMDNILSEFNHFLNNRYFINGRTKEDGGLLRIFPANTDDYVDVAPVANRLLFFWSDRRNPHEVQPAFKTRYAVTVWYMDKAEREKAKQSLVQEKMDTFQGEYALKEREHCKNERDSMCQTIEATATDAVSSLTDEELQALSTLIKGQNDPDAILASLGISPNITQKLLQRLKLL